VFSINIEISDALAAKIGQQDGIKAATSRAARKVALFLWSDNLKRIHLQGVDIEEKPIFGGKYSKQYAQHRLKKGRFIDKVTLFMTGELRNSLQVVFTGNYWAVGFVNEYGVNLRKVHEDRQGENIWGVTDANKGQVADIVRNEIGGAL
jgi:hypothetical protein